MDAVADLSLDDIIQKKFPKSLNRRGKGGGASRGRQRYQANSNTLNNNASAGKSGLQVRRGIQGRLGVGGRRGGGGIGKFPKAVIGDARSKITQQKRMKITDAREKLGEIAKQNDARQKLDRLRQLHTRGRPVAATAMNPLTVRGGIMAQTGHNGQLRLSTRKNRNNRKPKPPLDLQTIGRVISTDRRGVLSATIPSLLDLDTSMEEERPIIRRTVNNKPLSSSLMFSPARQRDSFSSWMNSASRDSEIAEDNYGLASRRMLHSRDPDLYASPTTRQLPQNFRVTARKTSPLHSAEGYYGSPTDMDIGYPEEDCPTPLHHNNSGNRASSGVKARLDTPTVMRRTMGILAAESKQATEASRTPTTHRIVVSNLQKSVTNEDIRELFEDIGSLVVSRLVRPGTAEVIYRTRKDAEKAVEIYHNRQLDGEPMKCMLVNPRSVPGIGQTSVSRNISSSLAGGSNKFRSSSSKGQKLSVTPDVATIHKALFKRP